MNDRRWAHLLERTARDARYDQLTTDELLVSFSDWMLSLPGDGQALGEARGSRGGASTGRPSGSDHRGLEDPRVSPSALSVSPDNPAAPPIPFPGAAGLPLS